MNALRLVFLAPLFVVTASPVAWSQDEGPPDHSLTYRGFSGLFNVIGADTLEQGEVSFGLVHRNYDRELTDIDVNDLAASFGIGITDRLEFGFSYVANRQMDFDDAFSGAFYNGFPSPVTTIESGGGDLLLGLKLALVRLEEHRVGLSLFGQVKVPTGDEEEGRGTGGWDVVLGTALGAARGEIGVHANVAYSINGDAELEGLLGSAEVDLADAFQWGFGLELGTRQPVKAIVELTGEHFLREETAFFVGGVEGEQEEAADLTVGFKLGGARHGGFTVGAAYVRNLLMADRNTFGGATNPNGWVAEVSFTSAQKEPLTPPPPPPPPPPLNHPPTCSVTASPKEVFPVYSSKPNTVTLTVQASDPDGDALSYSWSASGGSVSGSGASVTWQAADKTEEGTFTVTVRVTDGKGGEATCSDTVGVKPDPEYFEGRVQFEFDRYDLTAEARAIIERAAEHLRRYPNLKVTLEGHCCYIATEEYNLQLGQQRAESVRSQLGSLGVDASRISTISYGETRPWQDNNREITRRLNRRGEFRFRFSE